MYSFVVTVRPKSYNSWGSASVGKKQTYKQALNDAFRLVHPACLPLQGDLYGLVYHFHRTDLSIDADNLSKPIWDCLKGVLFADDKQVKMRIAGSFDLSSTDLVTLDFSGLAKETIDSLLEAIESEDHVLYIECGEFSMNLIRLNMESDGN